MEKRAMVPTLPTETVTSVYSPKTQAAVEELAKSSRDFGIAPFAEQCFDPEATENFHNGRLNFASWLDPRLTPPVARALVLDHPMQNLIRKSLHHMHSSLKSALFPNIYWYPSAIGIIWGLCEKSDFPHDEIPATSRLIFAAAASPSEAIARRLEFDATLHSWNSILTRNLTFFNRDFALFGLQPPHLDCLVLDRQELSSPIIHKSTEPKFPVEGFDDTAFSTHRLDGNIFC